MGVVETFLRKKPVKLMICLRDRSRSWNVHALSKEIDATYSYTLNLVKSLESMGLVKTKLSGRSRYVELTEVGDELALSLEGFFKVIERLDKNKP